MTGQLGKSTYGAMLLITYDISAPRSKSSGTLCIAIGVFSLPFYSLLEAEADGLPRKRATWG